MMAFLILPTWVPVRSDSCPRARLWSRRVMAVMFSAGMEGALSRRTAALVLAGLATTRIWTRWGSGLLSSKRRGLGDRLRISLVSLPAARARARPTPPPLRPRHTRRPHAPRPSQSRTLAVFLPCFSRAEPWAL